MSNSLQPQTCLSITNSWSLVKLMPIESVMPSNHLILCHPLLLLPSIFPASGSFQMSQFFASGGQSVGVSASVSVLPMNIQDWFTLGWTGWTSLLSMLPIKDPIPCWALDCCNALKSLWNQRLVWYWAFYRNILLKTEVSKWGEI